MDNELLVEEKDDGQRLIDRLVQDGIEVIVAFWLKTSENGAWQFYIASPVVDLKSTYDALAMVYSAINVAGCQEISPSNVKVIGENDSMAHHASDIRDRQPTKTAFLYTGNRLGTNSISAAYIYPYKSSLRIMYVISYYRNGNTNSWTAETERNKELLRRMTVSGAVAYTTARWEGETSDDEKHATVTVLVEVDRRFGNDRIYIHPSVWMVLKNQARSIADEMFLQHHPNAEINHVDDTETP